MVMILPEEYKEHMKEILGDGYESFISIYDDDRGRAYGLRRNLLKDGIRCCAESDDLDKEDRNTESIDRYDDEFIQRSGFSLEKISWADEGYYYDQAERPGKNALHEAGAYYIQEPSAMCAVPLLDIRPGEVICDMCAAPGGKSTQIAGRMGRRGLLVSNEIIKNRAEVLSSNIERMGVGNCVVTNEDPKDMASLFPCFFDKILVDAPCSGEGMFRKEENAINEWSMDNVHMCAERQRMILDCAAQMVRPGGMIVYSTCTFEPEEDEQTASYFIREHSDFKIMPADPQKGEDRADIDGAVRIWPHHARGEGHFAVRFVKDGVLTEREDLFSAGVTDTIADRTGKRSKGKRNDAGAGTSAKDNAHLILDDVCTKEAENEIISCHGFTDFGGSIYAVPKGMTSMSGLSVKRPGLQIVMSDDKGKKIRLMPAHALAMYLRPDEAQRSYEMDDAESVRFLGGESLPADMKRLDINDGSGIRSFGEIYGDGSEITGSESDGWILMTYRGYSAGWGKKTGSIIKNHYPKGLRRDVSLND